MSISTRRWFLLIAVLLSFAAAAGPGDGKARLLERFDTDGDGQLSESERAAAQEARGGRGDEDMAARHVEILEQFDVDRDGRLNDSERTALRESGMTPRGGRGGEGARKGGRRGGGKGGPGNG